MAKRSKYLSKFPAGYYTGGQPGGEVDEEEAQDETTQPTFPVTSPMRQLASMTTPQKQPPTAAPPVQRAPATSKDSVMSLREQLQKFLGQKEASSDNMQKLAEQYKDQLAQQNNGRTDFSPILELADSMYGTKLKAGYKKPLTNAEQVAELMKAQGLVDKSVTGTHAAADKEYGQDQNSVAKEQANYYRGLAGSVRDHRKVEQDELKQVKNMHDDMFLKRGTNPQVSQSINKLQRATSAVALVDSLKDMSPDEAHVLVTSGEMSNLATSIAGMVGNNNVISEHKLREITPKNVNLSGSNLIAWFLSEPQGVDQKKWIDRLMNEIDTEARAAHRTLNNYQDAQAATYEGLLSPEHHRQQREGGRQFLAHSYYNPDNPESYAVHRPTAKPPQAGGGAPGAAPKGGIPVTNKRTGAKGWKMPNGEVVPRD